MDTRVAEDKRRKARSRLPSAFQKSCLKITVILHTYLKYPHLILTKKFRRTSREVLGIKSFLILIEVGD